MAGLDQDNFSNISWHSEQNAAQGASSAAARDPANPDFAASRQEGGDTEAARHHHELEGVHGEETLECIVGEPHKENDGTKDAYVSYMITTHVSLFLFALFKLSYPSHDLSSKVNHNELYEKQANKSTFSSHPN
jgi:sorting nexin-4